MSEAVEGTEVMPDWLAAVAQPLPEQPCGEDPRYLDDFLTAKEEIDRKQDNQYALAARLCRDILVRQAKDLRAAGYLLQAAVYTEGASGLQQAVRGYRLLLEHFWEGCHPRQPSARRAALGLLNHPRIEQFAAQYAGGLTEEQQCCVREDIDAVNALLQQELGEDAVRWRGLDGWLQQLAAAALPAEAAPPAAEEGMAAPAVAAGGPISSERELQAVTRDIRDYLLQHKDYLRLVAYGRALRWGGLSLPPHEQGVTRIQPPRAAGVSEVQRAGEASRFEEAFLCCEQLFHEPGGQLLLDLQRLAAEAATGMGGAELAGFIRLQAQGLCRRLPELTGLQFDNGQPFADSATRRWLEDDPPVVPSAAAGAADPWEESFAEQLAEARRLAAQRQLPAAMALLKACPAASERQRLRVRMGMAELCLEGRKAPLAASLLAPVWDGGMGQGLALWDPALAVQLGQLQQEALRQVLLAAPAEQKPALEQRLASLRDWICRADPESAVRLF